MTSDVYFANLRASGIKENKVSKIQKLFDKAGFKNFIGEKDLTAIKVHFGEKGNDSFVNPIFVRQIVDKIKQCGAKPFVTDTNTLYCGTRHNSVDHIITAIEHGYDYSVVGAPVIIADGLRSKNYVEVEISQKHIKSAKVARDIRDTDSMIVVSHFKGHCLAGFGGAVKNLAMGCTPAAGKLDQHCIRPLTVDENCVGCGKCLPICPAKAIKIENGKCKIDLNACIGCGECISICQHGVIEIDWATDIEPFMERMTEYALGVVKDNEQNIGYINFLINITPECDCLPWSDTPIVPDIGILASKDPVALDKACLDLVNKQVGFKDSALTDNHQAGEDKFKGANKHTQGQIQLYYAEEIGLGSTDYKLIEV